MTAEQFYILCGVIYLAPNLEGKIGTVTGIIFLILGAITMLVK